MFDLQPPRHISTLHFCAAACPQRVEADMSPEGRGREEHRNPARDEVGYGLRAAHVLLHR